MNSQHNEAPAVHLKNNSSTLGKAYLIAGLVTFMAVAAGVQALRAGEWPTLSFLFLGVALFAYLLAMVSKLTESESFATLYPDRIEIPGFRNSRRVVHWNQVSELRWYGTSNSSAKLRVYTDEIQIPLSFFEMDLGDLIAEERLTFISYVRKAAHDIEQKNWARFCRSTAVPLLDKIERHKNLEVQEDSEPLSLREKFLVKGLEWLVAHPFLSMLFFPFAFLVISSLSISRRTCWTVATMIAISGSINIRLFWGQWLEPFTTICVSFVALFVLLALISLRDNRQTASSWFMLCIGYFYYAIVLIALPLAANLMAKGWIPNNLAKPLLLLTAALLFAPLILINLRPSHLRKHSRKQLEEEALQRWETFEQQETSGELPSI